MKKELAFKIINEAADIGVHSLKMNGRGESTMNPHFESITDLAKRRSSGMTLIDRITNSNFNFKHNREDIFKGLRNQTKVKVSFDSFQKDIFESQRVGSKYEETIANINKFYNYPNRDNELVIQAVRTLKNKDEDLEHEIKKRWPSATVSIRDVVSGRVDKDLSDYLEDSRDFSNRQSCIQFHARLVISSLGIVSGCCVDLKQKLLLGDANKQHIVEIWNSDAAKKYRKSLLDKSAFNYEPCKGCSSYESFKNYKAPWSS